MYINENPPSTDKILRLEILGWLVNNNSQNLSAESLVEEGKVLEKFVIGETEPPKFVPGPSEFYNENTLVKVRQGLMNFGLQFEDAEAAIVEMQNRGILFRERGAN